VNAARGELARVEAEPRPAPDHATRLEADWRQVTVAKQRYDAALSTPIYVGAHVIEQPGATLPHPAIGG
jgi:hypothetical protein